MLHKCLNLKPVILMFFLFLIIPAAVLALTPVARFDVVPYQRISYGETFNVGVVAFSKPGIASVEFTISGQGYSGGVKTSKTMTLNTQLASVETTGHSGVWEYWVPVSFSEFTSNGPINISAKVTDKGSNVRNLDPITLIVEATGPGSNVRAWVDASNGSDSMGKVGNSTLPFKSISAAVTAAQMANGGKSDGNIIYLQNGTYSINAVSGVNTTTEYLTITRASGAVKESVIINEGRPYGMGFLKISGITLQSRGSGTGYWVIHSSDANYLWINDCRLIGSGRWSGNTNPALIVGANKYVTNTYIYDADYGFYVASFARGVHLEKIGNDAFQNTGFIVNCSLNDISNGDTDWHADAYQAHTAGVAPASNRIIYNYKATNVHYQGIFLRADAGLAKDNAFVNVMIEMKEPPDLNENNSLAGTAFTAFSLNQAWDHLILWHCTFSYSHSEFYATSITNSSFVGNIFWDLLSTSSAIGTPNIPVAEPKNAQNNEWLYNHFINVYAVTSGFDGTSVDIARKHPCPHWYAKMPDSDISGSATAGGGVLDVLNIGVPVEGSVLIDRIPFAKVPADIYGKARNGNPDVGAVEHTSSSNELSRPVNLEATPIKKQ